MVSYEKVEDTFFEYFDGMYIRALITAEDELTVKQAAYDCTATPSAVIGRVEAGVESFVDGSQTPDGRPGAIVQFWLTDDLKKFEKELSYFIVFMKSVCKLALISVPARLPVFNDADSKAGRINFLSHVFSSFSLFCFLKRDVDVRCLLVNSVCTTL